ncbi:hypothetical protein J537_2312 [Acinetobacter baumannii 1437282]|uniref:hypothetical protein n=1 Tax=Acinetobacter dispersus TaxID=70348 RepID=UPI0004500759|nr:hypothetical protein [Acinetobacter dispersus]EXB26079.1 hypothetical protein J537_2312 [Acinetobacter baumannii 1437282]QHH96701.1 hypothetical protein FPL17_03750 [Acinetobacter dispersus]
MNKICLEVLKVKKNEPFLFLLVSGYLFFIFSYLFIYLFYMLIFVSNKTIMPLNELGDFLSGVFSPLAFLFLYLGYKQNTKAIDIQARELITSNKALEAQAIELKNNVEQQIELVKISNEQLRYYQEKDLHDHKLQTLKAKPEFTLNRRSSSTTGDTFNIKNLGGNAKYIKCTRPKIEISSLQKNGNTNFHTDFKVDFLTISYQDENGNSYSTEFHRGESNLGYFKTINTQSH